MKIDQVLTDINYYFMKFRGNNFRGNFNISMQPIDVYQNYGLSWFF